MEKPTRTECLAWAEEDEAKAAHYRGKAAQFRKEGLDASADLFEAFAKARDVEAKDLRLFAKTCT